MLSKVIYFYFLYTYFVVSHAWPVNLRKNSLKSSSLYEAMEIGNSVRHWFIETSIHITSYKKLLFDKKDLYEAIIYVFLLINWYNLKYIVSIACTLTHTNLTWIVLRPGVSYNIQYTLMIISMLCIYWLFRLIMPNVLTTGRPPLYLYSLCCIARVF